MTREEAIEVVMMRQAKLALNNLTAGDLREIAESDVDIWSALGLLKLDEPKTADDLFHQRLKEDYHRSTREYFLAKLDSAGLKIVEK